MLPAIVLTPLVEAIATVVTTVAVQKLLDFDKSIRRDD